MRHSLVVTMVLLTPFAMAGPGPNQRPSTQVNPFIGTAPEHGKVFPGATTPFGMVQLSPDSQTGGDLGCGYLNSHTTIEGFSFTHMSGVGWYGDLGNLLVQATRGSLKTFYGLTDQPGTGYLSRKAEETAHAGYYAVTLSDYDIRAEATVTAHAGLLRFTFPHDPTSRIQIDLARRVGGTSVRQSVKMVGPNAIEGWMRCTPEGGGWGNGDGKPNYTVYFRLEFSRPPGVVGIWEAEIPIGSSRKRETIESPEFASRIAQAKVRRGCREAEGDHLGFFAEFPTRAGEHILVKVGISFVDSHAELIHGGKLVLELGPKPVLTFGGN